MIAALSLPALSMYGADIVNDSIPATVKGFAVSEGHFMLDGEPMLVKAAELHYPRIPRPYWEHRIKM